MAAVIQRPLRGSRISSFYPVKQLPSLSSLDSAFQLQEYISLLIRLDVHDVDAIVSLPGKSAGKERESDSDSGGSDAVDEQKDGKTEDKDGEKGKGDVTVDEACWIYEQLRRLAQDLSHPLITTLQQECTRASCSEMKAGEWLYLCVAHGNDGAMEQCCAIDYILHTLDSATALLNSPRAFPSRLQIPPTSHRHFSSLARRLGRIFAHAYFHHREAFEQAEAESSLYARFLALTAKFDLVPAEFLVIPSSAIGGSGSDDEDGGVSEVQPPRLLAAAIDPAAEREKEREREKENSDRSREPPQQQRQPHLSAAPPPDRAKSKSPPSLGLGIAGSSMNGSGSGLDSPRRVGRNRTDTMVFSEASAVADELARFGEEEAALKTARPELDGRLDMGVSPEDELGPEAAIKGAALGTGQDEDEEGDAEPISPTDAVVSGSSSPPLERLVQSSAVAEPAVTADQEEPPIASSQQHEDANLVKEAKEEKEVPPLKNVTKTKEEQPPSEPSAASTLAPATIETEAMKPKEIEVEHVDVLAPVEVHETPVENNDSSLSVETPEPELAPTPEAPAVESEDNVSSDEIPASLASDGTSSTLASDSKAVAPPPAMEEDAAASATHTTSAKETPPEMPAIDVAEATAEATAEADSEPVAVSEPLTSEATKPAAPTPAVDLEAKSFAAAAKSTTTEPKIAEASDVETKGDEGNVEGEKA